MTKMAHRSDGPKTRGNLMTGRNPRDYQTTNAISNKVAGGMNKASNKMSEGPVFQRSGKRGAGAS